MDLEDLNRLAEHYDLSHKQALMFRTLRQEGYHAYPQALKEWLDMSGLWMERPMTAIADWIRRNVEE